MTNSKWYVVWVGKTPGIYTSWDDTKHNVHGVPGAKYQSFKTEWAAKHAYDNGPGTFQDIRKKALPNIVTPSISVDAACSGNPGVVEYQGVTTDTKKPLFHKKIEGIGTNNCGEFLAIVHGFAWQAQMGSNWPIYSDSDVAMGWVNKKVCKTTLEKNNHTAPIFELIDRAQQWLKSNQPPCDVLKWLTNDWGEIPADFGRKS
jgi:ribonuclease HI